MTTYGYESQSLAPFIRDSIRIDMWGPLISGASGPKFSMCANYATKTENICSKCPFYPQPKAIPRPHLSRVFVTKFPPRTISVAPWISPRLHLPPFPSTKITTTTELPPPLKANATELPLPPHRICFPSASTATPKLLPPSATTSALDLLPHRPLPPHRIYFPVGHYLRTRSATQSSTTSAPELLLCRPLPLHQSYSPIVHYLHTGSASPSATVSIVGSGVPLTRESTRGEGEPVDPTHEWTRRAP